ncbi:uncharacterized protein VICG_01668 [Vittaforma corneae ATCC 50505]|uniref:Ubiquitin-like domain-containing protein n=1 Tax=Vittaforma corneae (strain ATCC 50505) TaxID=993615 RepID=L2GLB1_VITCO|nr:uncharacterized protein VICG_01668 [Vittaforma corneae ATCC 50505]ELA41295.1 hypothetical protein VICG_01668 [Vittaforma corneae ATCC 50505]
MSSIIRLRLQFLATEKEIEIEEHATVDNLKNKVEESLSIPVDQQSLTVESRNIGVSTKTIVEIGLKDGSIVVVKRIRRVNGTAKSGGLSSLIKNNPMVKNMLKNPSAIKTIQEMFPDLKSEIEENSSLNMLMNNEGMEDELERFAADDDYMNTQMRNADITMAKLQNLPDGVRLMSSLAKDTGNLGMIKPSPGELKGGQTLTSKNNKAIPGKNAVNYLVEYRKQLLELKNIGFEDVKENIEVLKSVNGDLQSAQQVLIRKYEANLK